MGPMLSGQLERVAVVEGPTSVHIVRTVLVVATRNVLVNRTQSLALSDGQGSFRSCWVIGCHQLPHDSRRRGLKQSCIQCPDALCTLCVKSALYALRILMPLADYISLYGLWTPEKNGTRASHAVPHTAVHTVMCQVSGSCRKQRCSVYGSSHQPNRRDTLSSQPTVA